MGRLDVGDDQPRHGRARRGRCESGAEVDRGPGAGGRELDNAKPVQRGGVVVQPPTQAFVELLGSVDVGHGNDVDLELHVDRPDARVGARGLCFGGGHVNLLVALLCMGTGARDLLRSAAAGRRTASPLVAVAAAGGRPLGHRVSGRRDGEPRGAECRYALAIGGTRGVVTKEQVERMAVTSLVAGRRGA